MGRRDIPTADLFARLPLFKDLDGAALARQADLLQVVITMDTRVQTLRDYYLEDMPGLQFDRTSTNEAGETVSHLIRHPQPPIQEER